MLFLSLTIGLLYGTILIRQNDAVSSELINLCVGQTAFTQSVSILDAFLQSFLSLFGFLLIPYLCGFCAIGQAGACLTLLFKGLGIGAGLAGYYVQHQWQGVGYCAVAIIPPAVCAVLTLFLACRESIRLSNRMFRLITVKEPHEVGMQMLRLYHIKFFVIVILALGSSVIGAFFSVWFQTLFVPTGI